MIMAGNKKTSHNTASRKSSPKTKMAKVINATKARAKAKSSARKKK